MPHKVNAAQEHSKGTESYPKVTGRAPETSQKRLRKTATVLYDSLRYCIGSWLCIYKPGFGGVEYVVSLICRRYESERSHEERVEERFTGHLRAAVAARNPVR